VLKYRQGEWGRLGDYETGRLEDWETRRLARRGEEMTGRRETG